jgi:hypothetical protein
MRPPTCLPAVPLKILYLFGLVGPVSLSRLTFGPRNFAPPQNHPTDSDSVFENRHRRSVRIERAKSQQINQSGAKPGAATDVTSIARYTRGIIYVLHLSNQISRRCLNRRFLLFIVEKNNCAPETALNESASKKCHIDYGASIVRHYYF